MNNRKTSNLFQNLRLSVKLTLGFSVVTLLIILIAFLAATSLNAIDNQNKVLYHTANADESLSLARIGQLQFETDNEKASADYAFSQIDSGIAEMTTAKSLMKTEKNRQNAQDMIDAMNAYRHELDDYVKLAAEKDASGAARVAAATETIGNIKDALSKEEAYIETLDSPNAIRASYHKYLLLQNAFDSFMEARVTANKYVRIETKDLATTLLELVADAEKNLTDARALIVSKEVLLSVDSSLESINKYEKAFNDYKASVELQELNKNEMIVSAESAAKAAEEIKAGVEEYFGNAIRKANIRNIELVVAALIISIIVTIFLTKSITTPLNEALRIIDSVSHYDLTQVVPEKLLQRKDEMGILAIAIANIVQRLRSMAEGLHQQADQLDHSAADLFRSSKETSNGALEVAKTVEEIAEGATDQAKRTEEGVYSVSELDKLIQHEQEAVSSLMHSVEHVMDLKDDGIAIVDTLVEDTQKSQDATSSVQAIIQETNASAEKIARASLMIKNIADQTNLLALNAAIEAARAGEAGRGFAVVAEEIRKLAEQSNAFTDDISRTINDLIVKADQAVATMEMARQIVLTQSNSVTETNATLNSIAEAMEAMKDVMSDLHQSSKNMDRQKNVMIDVMETLSSTSEENAAGAEEISATVQEQTASLQEFAMATDSLKEMANAMKDIVNSFKL